MLLRFVVSGHLSALCNCRVSSPGPVSTFAQTFQIALGRETNPSCTTTTEERQVPAQPCRLFWGMTKADGACTSFAAQRWHIFASASWSETSPLTLLILQYDPSQRSCTPALGHSLGVTPICIIAFALK